jgi:hypothetical protein
MAKQSGGPSDYTNNAGKLTGIGDRKEPPLTEFGSFPARPSDLEGRQVRASEHFDRRYLVSRWDAFSRKPSPKHRTMFLVA